MRIFILFITLPFIASAQNILIEPASHARVRSPISVHIIKPGQGFYGLFDRSNGKTYPLQWENNNKAWFILEDSLPAGKQKQFELKKIKKIASPVVLSMQDDGIMVKNNGQPVLLYHTNTASPPPDSPAYYQRSGFIHPVFSPSGKVLTDDFPVTHAHQHAVFHAWADTRFRNQHVDFWNQFKKEGTVKHTRVLSRKEGPVYAEFKAAQEYLSFVYGAILTETLTVRIFATSLDHFIFDLFIEQENNTNDTLFLDKYIYGGLAFRGAKQWDWENKAFQNHWQIVTSENLQDSTANHKSAKWVTASGQIDGSLVSVTVFDHASNFRYPQKIRVHPTMPYWAYSPVVDGAFIIAPGGKYKARYRYYISDNATPKYLLQSLHQDWIGN